MSASRHFSQCPDCIKPLVVGVCGATRSGKSTIAKALLQHYKLLSTSGSLLVTPDEAKTIPFCAVGPVVGMDQFFDVCVSGCRGC